MLFGQQVDCCHFLHSIAICPLKFCVFELIQYTFHRSNIEDRRFLILVERNCKLFVQRNLVAMFYFLRNVALCGPSFFFGEIPFFTKSATSAMNSGVKSLTGI